ncbi:MAG: hypothetical protein IPK97_17010 [Ahniella sp.]|nr:hypothetical protein [Ahniella sp.]
MDTRTHPLEPALPEPAEAARTLSHWMSVFWKLHPGEDPVKPDLHVSIQTLTVQMEGWLIHQAGGVEAFWRLLCGVPAVADRASGCAGGADSRDAIVLRLRHGRRPVSRSCRGCCRHTEAGEPAS